MKIKLIPAFAVLIVLNQVSYGYRAGEPVKLTGLTPGVTGVIIQPVLQPVKTEAPQMENIKQLPKPEKENGLPVEKTIALRRSVRNFKNQDLAIEQISQILWAAQGITDESKKFRSAPSAGALYPIEIYIVSSSGTYHYIPDGHKIELIQPRDQRRELSNACGGQSFVAEASIDVIIVAVYGRTTWRYGSRGIRYVDMEAGHIAENIHLQAVSMKLGSISAGAFNEEIVKKLIGLTNEQQAIYIIPVGYPQP